MHEFQSLNGIPGDIYELKRRKEHVKRIVVEHPKYKSLLDKLNEIFILSEGSEQPDSVFLSGETGVGKTTLLKMFYDQYPRENEEGYTKIPVLYTKVPVGATPKSLASQILLHLGDPNHDRGTEPNQTARLLQFIEKCNVQMVIIDEFQHLIDRDSRHVLNKASEWVKSFTEDVKIPVVLCGMPESSKIFKINEQLGRRYCEQEKLESFKYVTKDDQILFRAFLNVIDKQLPFPNISKLSSPKTSGKIYYATNGVPAYVMKLLEKATVLAVKHGMDSISEEDLRLGFKSLTFSKRPNVLNPFNTSFNLLEAIEKEKLANRRHG